MNKQQFMAELKQLLEDLPESERDEALDYYEGYFVDAGKENEQQLIMKLESPAKVAKMIKSGLEYEDEENGEFSETGFSGFFPKDKNEIVNTDYDEANRGFNEVSTRPNRRAITYLVVFIILATFLFPLFGTLIGFVFSMFVCLVAIAFMLIFGGVGLSVGGVACLIVPIFVAMPVSFLLVGGAGIMMLAIGILMTWLGGKWIKFIIPQCGRILKRVLVIIVSLIKKLFVRLTK